MYEYVGLVFHELYKIKSRLRLCDLRDWEYNIVRQTVQVTVYRRDLKTTPARVGSLRPQQTSRMN